MDHQNRCVRRGPIFDFFGKYRPDKALKIPI